MSAMTSLLDRWEDRLALGCIFLALVAGPMLPVGADTGRDTRFSRSLVLAWYPPPRIAMVGDVDGDGRHDFVGYYPGDRGIIDVARMSSLGKPLPAIQANTQAGPNAVAALCANFVPGERACVLLVMPDGELRLVHGASPGQTVLPKVDAVGSVAPPVLPRSPLLAAVGDCDGDGLPDAVLDGADGRLLVLRNACTSGHLAFRAVHCGRVGKLRRLVAADVDGDGSAELIGQMSGGQVVRWRVARDSEGTLQLTDATVLARGKPGDGLAAGRFRGGKAADILIGRRLYHGQTEEPTIPSAKDARTDYAWLVGDLDGDGDDDLVRCQRGPDPIDGDHVRVHYAFTGDEVEGAPFGDFDNDGLLNAWETGRIRPGGLDLPALGCSPRRQDVICEVQRFEDFPEDRTRAEMERVVAYFRSLPTTNPDGATGIHLHVIIREPIPLADLAKPWWTNGEKHHPLAHRGITHWMQVANGGGGQSSELSDRGGCGGLALYATFIHEFGHQLGLDHSGRWKGGQCPIYPSLMNYAYSYQLGGKGDAIGYSNGRLRHIVLREWDLSEYLPARPEDLVSVSGPPYHFRVRPAPDGKGTLVDWNWNGVFGEKHVKADVDYGYSTTAGLRHTIGKTYTAPALVAIGTGSRARLLLFGTRLPPGAPLPPADASALHPSLGREQPGRLYVRVWLGTDPSRDGPKWSDETWLETEGVTGDPSACRLGDRAVVAYPTLAGVSLRAVYLQRDSRPVVSAPVLVPNSTGAEVTVATVQGRILVVLWRGTGEPLEYLWAESRRDGLRVSSVTRPLDFVSTVPVGAAQGGNAGRNATVWLGLMQNIPGGWPSRFQVRRLEVLRDGSLREISMEWIGGEKGGERGSSRVILIHFPDRTLSPDGQLAFFACGLFGEKSPWACHYVCTRIADRTVNSGWLTRRYYDEWTTSRSAPGVAPFRGDLAFAARWFGNVHATENDDLFVGFFGSGVGREPMGDFDDVAFIRDYGLSRSIGVVYSDPEPASLGDMR